MSLLSTASPILLVIAGFVVCFFGYRLLRFTLGLAGFAVGLALGFAVAGLITGISQVFTIVLAVVCGIIGAVLATVLYKVGVFLFGAGASVLLAGIIVTATGWHYPMLARVIAAVAGGVLTLMAEKPLVSILSAFAGAWGIVLGAFQLLGWYHVTTVAKSSPANFGYMVLAWVIVGVIGSLAQLGGGKRLKDGG
jgi:hypothetical protein